MDLSIATKDLTDHATWVAQAAPKRPTTPTLAGMLLTAGADGDLTLAASDYETSTTATTDAHVDTAGAVLVSARLFATVLATLPTGGTTTLTHDGVRLNITSGTANFKLATMDAADYPQMPGMPQPLGQIPAAELATAVAQVAPFASTDETLAILTGVHLNLGHTLTLTATDRYRVGERTLTWEPTPGTPDGDREILIDHRALTLATRGLTGNIQLGASDTTAGDTTNTFGLTDGVRTLLARPIDGEYPKVRKLLARPLNDPATVEADAAELLAAVKRTSTVLSRNEPILLDATQGALTVHAGAETDQSSDTIDATLAGTPRTLAFNAAYLVDVLTVQRTERIRLDMPIGPANTSGKAGHVIITPVGADDYRVVIVPVRHTTAQAVA